jgi:hypothetical protein
MVLNFVSPLTKFASWAQDRCASKAYDLSFEPKDEEMPC